MDRTSFNLTTELKRGAKAAKSDIGEMSRRGIEQRVIPQCTSCCWICGSVIFQDSEFTIDRNEYFQDLLGMKTSPKQLFTVDEKDKYKQFIKSEMSNPTSKDDGLYFKLAAAWLQIPNSQPIQICESCESTISAIVNREILINQLPIPFLYRKPEYATNSNGETTDVNVHVSEYSPNPLIAYGAQTAAIAEANVNPAQDPQANEILWFAARDRHNLSREEIWPRIAARSNLYQWAWGNQPKPIFKLALQKAVKKNREFQSAPLSAATVGWGGNKNGSPQEIVQNYISKYDDRCPACGHRWMSDYYCACGYVEPQCTACFGYDIDFSVTFEDDGEISLDLFEATCEDCGEDIIIDDFVYIGGDTAMRDEILNLFDILPPEYHDTGHHDFP